MWQLLLVCALLGSGHARMVKKQSGATALPANSQTSFTNTFRQGVYLIVASAYEEALVERDLLTTDFTACEDLIDVNLELCKSDAKNECSPTVWEAIDYYITDVAWGSTADFFSAGWSAVEGWEFWDDVGSFVINDVGDFFGDIGDWSGWGDIESVFIDIGDWFSGAWDDFIDFSNWRRKKRSLSASPASVKSARNLSSKLRGLQKMKANAQRVNAHDQARTSRLSAREIDSEVLACMRKASSCDAFVNDDTEETINTLCGTELLIRNASLAADVTKIKWVVAAVNDTVDLIVIETAYGGTMDMVTMTFSETWITAVFPTGDMQYLSAEAYDIMDPGTTAANTAIEYWTKYDEYD